MTGKLTRATEVGPELLDSASKTRVPKSLAKLGELTMHKKTTKQASSTSESKRIAITGSRHIATLQVSREQQYGKTHYYPENKLAHAFAQLMKQKAFSSSDIENIKALNYKVVLIAKQIQETEL